MKRRLSGAPKGWRIGQGSQSSALGALSLRHFGEREPVSALSLGEERVTESPSNPDSHQRLPPVREKQACTWQLRPDTFWPARSLPRFVLAAASLLWMQVEKGWTLLSIKMFNSEDQLPPPLPRDQRCCVAMARRQGGTARARWGEARFAPSFEARAVVSAGWLTDWLARSCTHKLIKKKKGGKKGREYLHLWEGAGERWGISQVLNGATGQSKRRNSRTYKPDN